MDLCMIPAEGRLIVHNIKTTDSISLFRAYFTCSCTMFYLSMYPFIHSLIQKILWGPLLHMLLVRGEGHRPSPRLLGALTASAPPANRGVRPLCHWLTQFLQLQLWESSLTNPISFQLYMKFPGPVDSFLRLPFSFPLSFTTTS